MPSGPADAGAPPRPVLVTRPAGREGVLVSRLAALGLLVEHQPLIRLVLAGQSGPVEQAEQAEQAEHAEQAEQTTELGRARAEELRAALARLADGGYSHLVLTSRTAVEALVAVGAVGAVGGPGAASGPGASGSLSVPSSTRVIAVGAGTAEALTAAGLPVHHIAGGSGAALVHEMPTADARLSTTRRAVLFPASAAASRTVPDGLTAKGYLVHEVTAYHPEVITPPQSIVSALQGGGYSAIVLTSPMIARAAAALGVHPSTAVITIGEPTSAAARAAGLPVTAQAAETTDNSLASAVQSVLTAAAATSSAPGRP